MRKANTASWEQEPSRIEEQGIFLCECTTATVVMITTKEGFSTPKLYLGWEVMDGTNRFIPWNYWLHAYQKNAKKQTMLNGDGSPKLNTPLSEKKRGKWGKTLYAAMGLPSNEQVKFVMNDDDKDHLVPRMNADDVEVPEGYHTLADVIGSKAILRSKENSEGYYEASFRILPESMLDVVELDHEVK